MDTYIQGFQGVVMSLKDYNHESEQRHGTTSQECKEAIILAEEILPTIRVRVEDYKLITAENMSTRNGDYKGPQYWHLTFKLRDLIQDKPELPIGAGGEIFVEIDLNDRRASLAGYGE